MVVKDSSGFRAGERVLWVAHPGSYAEYVTVPAAKLVRVPDGLGDTDAVAAGLQALTAQFLAESIGDVQAGDNTLVHAGAGGVGLLLIQLLKLRGARPSRRRKRRSSRGEPARTRQSFIPRPTSSPRLKPRPAARA